MTLSLFKNRKSALSLSPAPLCALYAAGKPELKRFTSEDMPFFPRATSTDVSCDVTAIVGAGIELAREDVIPFERKQGRFARDDRRVTTLPLVQNNILAPCVARRVSTNPLKVVAALPFTEW